MSKHKRSLNGQVKSCVQLMDDSIFLRLHYVLAIGMLYDPGAMGEAFSGLLPLFKMQVWAQQAESS